MPSENQGGSQRSRQRFDRIKRDIGEDPARWLDWDLLGDRDRRRTVWSLIDGIDTIERVRAWQAVERALAATYDREPRAAVMQRLDQREEWLQLHGERPDRLEAHADRDLAPVETAFPDRPAVEVAGDRATFSAERTFGPLRERYPQLFEDRDSDADSAQTGAVATDGGDGA